MAEDNEHHTGYVLPLCLRLIRKAFDGTGCTVYTDKAFTTIKLARALAKRGIGLVGMIRAARPKKMPRGFEHYWPFRAYATSERESVARGWARRAYCALPIRCDLPRSRLIFCDLRQSPRSPPISLQANCRRRTGATGGSRPRRGSTRSL